MSDDMISQEEIDALLNGGGIPAADGDAAPAGESEAPAEEPASPDSSSSQFDDVLTDIGCIGGDWQHLHGQCRYYPFSTVGTQGKYHDAYGVCVLYEYYSGTVPHALPHCRSRLYHRH